MRDLRVIGELRLSGATAGLPASRRARGLLGWLAVHPGAHHRSRLAGLFWPDVLEASARASLRSAMWALRPALGSCLITSRDTVSLGGEIRVDVREFRRLLAAGQTTEALALADGGLLQEMDDDWVLDAREELDRDVAGALAELTRQAVGSGDTASALSWALRWAALCPLDETAGAALIRAHIDAGDGPAAVAAFGRLRQRLGTELGVPVSAATEALVAPLRTTAAAAPRWPGTSDPPPAGLVGRDRQFGELIAGWRTARAGTGAVILLAGEGGIGKTRLVLELQTRAGATAVRAGPVVAAPFVLWTEALSELVAVTGRPDEPWTADLARIVPSLGQPGPTLSDPQLERVRLCEAVVQFLGWAARRAPLLVAFEDVHLADGASLDLIAYAGRRLRRMPVLLVLTRRLLPVRQQLDGVLSALRSHGALAAELELGPLPGDAVRELIRSAAPDLAASVIRQITELADGSPLLAIETARAAAGGAADIPAGLAGVVRQAMGGLSVPARLCAEFAAAAGRDLDRAEVAALPLPSPARDVAEALGSGLLAAVDGRLGFRHTLLRDAAYQALAEPVRVRLHGELARILRKRGGQRAAEIARHLLLAGQDEAAVAHLALAARDARRVADVAAASGFLSEALRIEPGDPEMLIELAEVQAFLGVPDESDRAFDRALGLIAPADSGALISAWLRRGRWLRGGICHPRESRRSYQSALDVLDRDPDAPARAEALAGLAWAEAVAGDPGEVDALLAEADRILGSNPSDLLAHDIGVARGHALIRAGQFTASFGPLIAASTAAGRAGRPDMAYSCLSNAASAAVCAGDFGRALDFADRCLPLVTPNGLLRLCVYAQVARSAILRRLDRRGEARQACDAAAGYAGRIGLPELDGLVRAERGLLELDCVASGAGAGAAVVELAAALELGAPVSRPATRLRLAEALALASRPDAAEAELRNVVLEPVGPADFPATLVARMSRVQGLIAVARGDIPLAGRRMAESVAAWQRVVATLDGRQAGADYVASLIDLGRPPVSALVEPAAELALVTAELATLRGR
ncbi:MAG TPA: AAA family ATPase [Streptosporangiaceae bacterium]|nr:AAA family ATPase [Streptosporangiaceae bacterium]